MFSVRKCLLGVAILRASLVVPPPGMFVVVVVTVFCRDVFGEARALKYKIDN